MRSFTHAPFRLAVAAIAVTAAVVAAEPVPPAVPVPPDKDARVAIGKEVPDFTLADSKGRKHTLSKYAGRIVVLEWIDPSCPFVMRHYRAGSMKATRQKLRRLDDTAIWLAINSTRFTTAARNEAWAAPYKIDYPILIDADGTVGRRLDARRAPQMFVIDKKGVLRYRGAIDDNARAVKDPKQITNYVVAAVTALVEDKPVEPEDTKPYGCAIKYAK